jgi:hypothetical protein
VWPSNIQIGVFKYSDIGRKERKKERKTKKESERERKIKEINKETK